MLFNCIISNYYDNISSIFKFCFYGYSISIKKFLLCLTTRIPCFTCTLPFMQNTNTPFGGRVLLFFFVVVGVDTVFDCDDCGVDVVPFTSKVGSSTTICTE